MDNFKEMTGGKWWKVDFHLHSPGSYDYGHGDNSQKTITPEEYLLCCMKKKLDCIVVTDHNTFEWIPKLRLALNTMKQTKPAGFREIVIFPGIEFNVQGNVHLLGIFDPDIDEKNLNAIPYLVEYDETLETTKKSINEVIDIIVNNNGIAIPAHVDGPSGLFYDPKPTIIKTALQTDKLLAIEVLGDNVDNAIYRDFKLKLSLVVGSDSHTTETIGEKFTWVKMGYPNIEALRLALYDTDDGAIRYMDMQGNPNDRHGKTYVKSLAIQNGKYIGRGEPYVIKFSPWLNSIIGGRGSGKSAVLKFLRMVLDRGDELPQALKQDYEDFVKVPSNRTDLGMLQKKTDNTPGTTVIVDICVDGVDHSLKWEDGTITELNAETRNWGGTQSIKERFPIRMFSQKQLFEMTADTGLLFRFLDAQWNYNTWREKVVALKAEYCDQARKLQTLYAQKEKIDERKVALSDVIKKISAFETERTKTILQKKDRLTNQQKIVKEVFDSYASFLQWTKDYSLLKPLEECEELTEIDEDDLIVLKRWKIDLDSVISQIGAILSKNESLFFTIEALVESLPLSAKIKKNQTEMSEIIEELRSAGVDDIDRYAELLRDKERIEKEIAELGDVPQQIESCLSMMKEQEQRWIALVQERYDERTKVLQLWNQLGALRLSLIPFADISQNEKEFRQIIRRDNESVFNKEILEYSDDGSLTKKGELFFLTKESDISEKMADLATMKARILNASADLGKRFSDYLKKFFLEHPESVSELKMWIPADSLKLELNMNTKGKARYRSIDAGSPGQRTSAILSLILGISTVPIVIDQPEDDLDTRNITDIVVSSINKMKKHQQIIVVTHNPNIVVNTNSEHVIQLDYNNGQIENACTGALQNHDVRDAICEVMEGGKDALAKRYYRIFKALESQE